MSWTRTGIAVILCSCSFWCLVACGGESSQPAASVSQADPSTSKYKPTPPHPEEVGAQLVGPVVYTIDARSKDVWMYFDFSRGSVVAVQDRKVDAWDLAFQRHVIRTNGGETNPAAQGALFRVETPDFAAVTRVPEHATFHGDIRTQKRPFPYNPVVAKWYNYSYLANVLVPKPSIYIVRTQDGKYAKMRILSYYCEGGVSGCLTFEYVYQGNGSTDLAAPSSQVSHRLEQR